MRIFFCYFTSPMIRDAVILEKLYRGKEDALNIIIDDYLSYLLAVGSRYINDRQRVEDLIHDVLLDVWQRREKLQIKTGLKSYLRGALINKCLTEINKKRREPNMDHQTLDFLGLQDDHTREVIEANEMEASIKEIIDRLSPKCKEVFFLSRTEGKTHKEIAKQLDISTKTIENHITVALKKIRVGLKSRDLLIFIYLWFSQN